MRNPLSQVSRCRDIIESKLKKVKEYFGCTTSLKCPSTDSHFIKGSTKGKILKFTTLFFLISLLLKIGNLVFICNGQIKAVNVIPIMSYFDAII